MKYQVIYNWCIDDADCGDCPLSKLSGGYLNCRIEINEMEHLQIERALRAGKYGKLKYHVIIMNPMGRGIITALELKSSTDADAWVHEDLDDVLAMSTNNHDVVMQLVNELRARGIWYAMLENTYIDDIIIPFRKMSA